MPETGSSVQVRPQRDEGDTVGFLDGRAVTAPVGGHPLSESAGEPRS
jgi:hypothetical protein